MANIKARKSRGVRLTALRRSDFEMQRNAEIDLLAEPSKLKPRPISFRSLPAACAPTAKEGPAELETHWSYEL
jgi:hypothetical protein